MSHLEQSFWRSINLPILSKWKDTLRKFMKPTRHSNVPIVERLLTNLSCCLSIWMTSMPICIICNNNEFCDMKTLWRHNKFVHKNLVKCDQCNKEFCTKAKPKSHVDRIFECHVCPKNFTKLTDLKTHLRECHPEIKMWCLFQSVWSTRNHEKTHCHDAR